MNQSKKQLWVDSLKRDLPASFVVFLVALPLCIGISIASGVPVAAGLITGIVGGLVVGWIAGCPLQVSGPAAGLTVIVYDAVQTHGWQALGPIVLLAGLIQIAAGALRLGQWFRAVSPAVIKGMLAGIGFLIMASQFHVMIDDKPKGSGAENLVTIPSAIVKGLAPPDFSNRDARRLRSRALHEIGEVHRRQMQLQERLLVSTNQTGDGTLESADVAVVRAGTWEALAAQQTEITRQLTEAVTRFRKGSLVGNQKESGNILDAATVALRQSEAVGEALGSIA